MNRLAHETSPYLRQHKDNPVDWWPWCTEAFDEARRLDRPVLLSVGYSACHWCHVMAHECFEDPDVAAAMNAGFVNVKVDREDRPDVDAVYMHALQALTGGGGWPMTMFLTPEGRPFHGATYVPPAPLRELLARLGALWRQRRQDVEEVADRLVEAVRSGTGLPGTPRGRHAGGDRSDPAGEPALLEVAADALLARYDPEWGGFGRAPKFPQPSLLEALLVAHARTGRPEVLAAVSGTLDAMARGGIYDHVGGGFARYSTDRRWLVPHFEKMLYDNALLARVYLHAWQVTGAPGYRQVLEETLSYLLSPPVGLPGGGLASAEDADSEGVEGRFYVWERAEVLEVAGTETADWYATTPGGNWEGANILHRPAGGALERPPEVEEGRAALARRRATRPRPGLDDKVLTEWNAMAVAALAEAGAATGRTGWVREAESLAGFLLASSRRPDGRWMRTWQAGAGARHPAYAADHAWLVEAFTRLAEATGRSAWIAEARSAADALLGLFWDGDAGGFATTGEDADELIARPLDTQDGALPSANSVAAGALLRLAALTGAGEYEERARTLLEAVGPALRAAPEAFPGLVCAASAAAGGLAEVVVSGDRPDLLEVARGRFLPGAVLAWGEPFDSPLWEGRSGDRGGGLAYVCRAYACQLPSSTPEDLALQLDAICR